MVRLCQDNSLLIIVDVQEKLFPHISNHERLERHLVALIQGIQALQIPILCNQQYTKGLGETIPSVKALLSSVPVHEKLTFSCCGNESFMEALIALNRKNIILVGIESHICVQQTALDLLEKGFHVTLCVDALGSRKEVNHTLALRRMENEGAVLGSTESILFELLGTASHPLLKVISSLIKPLL